jgi:IS30 family transposase
VTWDQGKELAAHERFTVKTGLPVYFCDRVPRAHYKGGG